MEYNEHRTPTYQEGGPYTAACGAKAATGKALKITAVYFIFGWFWIVATDLIVELLFREPTSLFAASLFKGLFYVLVTAALIFALTFPPLKRLIEARDAIGEVIARVEHSNVMYKSLNKEYEKKQALMKSLINSIPDLIFYKDKDLVYMGCNRAFEAYTGKAEAEIEGKTDFELFKRKAAEEFRKADLEVTMCECSKRKEETATYPDGSRVYLETLKTPYYDAEGKVIGLIGISRDISERKKREEEIQYLNYHDVLTGIYNRAFFNEELKRLDTKRQMPLSVIVGDINGLKLINDALGHKEGDRALVDIADILKRCCRKEDILGRIGGDEFAVLLPKTDGQTAQKIVERINAACRDYMQKSEDAVLRTDIALGYATKTAPEESLDKIIKLAEDIMYRRKLLEYKSLHSSILASIRTTMFEKSNETEEHAERMAALAKELGRVVGLSEEDLVKLELVSALHDIGKVSIDLNILKKTEELNEEDWHQIKRHPEVGYRIANASPELSHISNYILCHHERWDGSGYPRGLAGETIPLISRILSIVDAYDAMTQDRAYRKAMPPESAAEEILKYAGSQFDPWLAEVFVEKVVSEAVKKA
jgi:diguanylate cyclase (GGDEF)-like protein/PAS domain S-box-containing protein